jgi:NADH:ubiquinone oxidoreductase subunit 4 (subunit M)
MLLTLCLIIPLLAGIICFFLKSDGAVKSFSLFASIALVAVVLYAIFLPTNSSQLIYSHVWIGSMNANFSFGVDGMAKVLIY